MRKKGDLAIRPRPTGSKICIECGEIKPLVGFPVTKWSGTERESFCRSCKKKKIDKMCIRCRQVKPKVEFSLVLEDRGLRKRYCMECEVRDLSLKERLKDSGLKIKYGITIEEYRALHAAQGGKCATCPRTEGSRKNSALAVDHCHRTGRIRGLLCVHCNRKLGMLEKDLRNTLSLLKYAGIRIEQ